jgi:hypothetical protein
MVTNGSKNGDGSYTYSTDGTRGSLPCPFNQVIKKYTSQSPLEGWSLTDGVVIDTSNAPVAAESLCKNGNQKTDSEFSWKYKPDTSGSDPPADKASVTIKPNIISNAAQDKAGYKIYLTYIENSSKTNVPQTAKDAAGMFGDEGDEGDFDAEDEGEDTGAKAPKGTGAPKGAKAGAGAPKGEKAKGGAPKGEKAKGGAPKGAKAAKVE